MSISEKVRAATECLDNGWTLIPIGRGRDGKLKPTCKWKQPPPSSAIFNHIKNPERTGTNGLLAFIPYSAGLIVIDIDYGGMVSVRKVQGVLDCEALARIRSKRKNGYHMLYATNEGANLTQEKIYIGEQHIGEVISARQYIHMHTGPAPYLEAKRGSYPVPGLVAKVRHNLLHKQGELFARPSLGSIKVCTGQNACEALKVYDTTAAIVKAARIGERHNTLLTVATFIVKSYANMNATLAQLTQTILYLNNQLCEPMPIDEVERIAAWAYQVAQHDGTKEKNRENKRENQRRMIYKQRTLHGLDERDIQIHEARKQGLSYGAIAKLFNMTKSGIYHVLSKPCPVQLSLLDRLNRTEN